MDWAKIHAELPDMLGRAQKALEESVEAFALAYNAEALALAEYRKKRAELVLKYKNEKMAVGVIDRIVDGEIAELEKEHNLAKGQKDKCRYLIEAYKERMYNLRHLNKEGEYSVKNG